VAPDRAERVLEAGRREPRCADALGLGDTAHELAFDEELPEYLGRLDAEALGAVRGTYDRVAGRAEPE
jgi:hypothetical protein